MKEKTENQGADAEVKQPGAQAESGGEKAHSQSDEEARRPSKARLELAARLDLRPITAFMKKREQLVNAISEMAGRLPGLEKEIESIKKGIDLSDEASMQRLVLRRMQVDLTPQKIEEFEGKVAAHDKAYLAIATDLVTGLQAIAELEIRELEQVGRATINKYMLPQWLIDSLQQALRLWLEQNPLIARIRDVIQLWHIQLREIQMRGSVTTAPGFIETARAVQTHGSILFGLRG